MAAAAVVAVGRVAATQLGKAGVKALAKKVLSKAARTAIKKTLKGVKRSKKFAENMNEWGIIPAMDFKCSLNEQYYGHKFATAKAFLISCEKLQCFVYPFPSDEQAEAAGAKLWVDWVAYDDAGNELNSGGSSLMTAEVMCNTCRYSGCKWLSKNLPGEL